MNPLLAIAQRIDNFMTPTRVADTLAGLTGVGSSVLSWMNLINTGLSIVLMLGSIAFLAWRWRRAVKRDRENSGG